MPAPRLAAAHSGTPPRPGPPGRAVLPILLLMAGLSAARAQAPSTDIYIVAVDGASVGKPARVTDRDGYDNQPAFLPDGRRLVYASQRDGQTDIYLHDLASGGSRPLQQTVESEYSPTPIPGRDAVSVVRDYGELKQQLWSLPLDGGEPEMLLPGVNPVGYHAWIDSESLLLFVLGEPDTLQTASVRAGSVTILADSPGRALSRIPGSREMSYVDKSDESWWLRALDPISGESRKLIATLTGREDCAWAPDGWVWMADGGRLFRWRPGEKAWAEAGDLSDSGISDISRLAFSPDGRTLALVAGRPGSE